MEEEHNLKNGSILKQYKIIRVLGAGGFGITYLALDTELDLKVVIKEYFPNEFAVRKNDSTIIAKTSSAEAFSKGLQRFKEEAQTLAKFNHPSIIKILGYFEANDTAYFVMEYEEGIDLAEYLKQEKRALTQEEILSIMMPILEGLKEVHKYNYLHRDIKPGNILLRKDKSPVLIDFGASKLALGEASKSITSMLTEGYAPLEQYSTEIKQQGAFTDLYAVAAVMYKMITGEVPPSAPTRGYANSSGGIDPYKSLMTLKLSKYDNSFLHAIDHALDIDANKRPQNVQEFQKDIAGESNSPKNKNHNILIAIILGIVFIFSVVAYYFLGTYTEEDQLNNSAHVVEKSDFQLKQKANENKVEEAHLKKEREEREKLKVERLKKEQEQQALEQELKKLREEKLRVQKEELSRLKREKEERITKEKKRQRKVAELKRLEQEKIKIYYSKMDTYYNGRFGFSFKYPTNLLIGKDPSPTNGDGVMLYNNDRTVEVTSYGGFAWNMDISTTNQMHTYSEAKQMYKDALTEKEKNTSIQITYKRQKNNWYVLSGYDLKKNKIFYEKWYLNNGIKSGFIILFPKNEKNTYEKLVNIISKSFKPSYDG